MKNIITLFTIITISVKSFACINEYTAFFDSTAMDMNITGIGNIWQSNRLSKKELIEKSQEFNNRYKTTNKIEDYSDYASKLIYLDSLKKAKAIYFEIEKTSPNLYTTASNLGTIYELEGKNDSALIWIKKSIKLNPKSHGGSEWVHVKILKFKISEKSNFEKSILGVDFGSEIIPNKTEISGIHIYNQLRERLNFIRPKNQIMGSLFFDLGNIVCHNFGVKRSIYFFQKAKHFGFESVIMDKRIKHFRNLLSMANKGLLDYVNPDGSIIEKAKHPDSISIEKKALLKREKLDSVVIFNPSNTNLKQETKSNQKKSPFTPEELLERQFKKTAFLVIGGFIMLGIVFIVFRYKKPS